MNRPDWLPANERQVAEALTRAQDLVRSDESGIPDPVIRTVQLLARRGVWHSVSRNHEARSCRDAAKKRQRLGHDGIPLWDELKSFFGLFANSAGQSQYVVAHCRGDRLLDFGRLAVVIKATKSPERLEPDELAALGMDYGLVNPFGAWALDVPVPYTMDGPALTLPVLQVFDLDLLEPVGVPGTVMTNAGDVTWAVEVHARDLCDRLDNTLAGDISIPDPDEPLRRRSAVERLPIGIITGNSPESGIALWNRVNTNIRALLGGTVGDISLPPVTVESLPEMGLSMELDRRADDVWAALSTAVVEMCRDGVGILSLACNTTPYFTPRIRAICDEYGSEFISMPEVLGHWLRAEGIERIALLGISYVSDVNGPWSAYSEPLDDIEVEVLEPRALRRLTDLAYEVKATGAKESGLNKLRSFLDQEVESDHIVLGLTELSVLFASQRKSGRRKRVLIDPLALYGEALARRWLGLPFPGPAAT